MTIKKSKFKFSWRDIFINKIKTIQEPINEETPDNVCPNHPDGICRLEGSPLLRQLEINIRIDKIRKAQVLGGLQPCYCNENVPKDNISYDMCQSCSFKETCDMRRTEAPKF